MKDILIISLALFLFSCTTSSSQVKSIEKHPDFNSYWYGGEAEISSYELEQVRYGEVHKGNAVMVFVTEPFSKRKQVKLDNWRDTSDDNVSVMKLNMTKKFITGIYPYSMMMSAFTPVSLDKHPNTFKVTTSSQEWCGHTFMQLNLTKSDYELKGFSYFESEGDIEKSVRKELLEDELWSRLKMNPAVLPTGEVALLPSTFYLRLKHKELEARTANCSLNWLDASDYGENAQGAYSIDFGDRKLTIYFEEQFPHAILGWEESYSEGANEMTTKARRINTIKSAYWGKNHNADREIRKQLGLSTD